MADSNILLRVEHLCKEFPVDKGFIAKHSKNARSVHAVNDVSFDIAAGETFGLVGESGCGKSTTGRCIMRLTEPTSGKVLFEGKDVASMNAKELKEMRRYMQFVFQDPYASLNPRMTIGEIVSEPLIIHDIMPDKDERLDFVRNLLDVVGLNPEHINRYPHEFSGGQRQRVGIARAFALRPKLIICDEPVSALDVSVQNQILNLLRELRDRKKLTYLFISHDLSVVRFLADRVCVMFLGRICEIAPTASLYEKPLHPYTRFLLNAVPKCDPHARSEETALLTGEVPSPVEVPSGCPFHTRCPYADAHCQSDRPALRTLGDHAVACHRAEELLQ